MKYISLLSASLFLFTLSYAQIDKAKEVSVPMSNGTQQGWKILVPSADYKLALKEWTKLMKQYDSKTSKVKRHEEHKSDMAKIPSLSEREVIVFAQFDETPEGVYLTVFFDLGGAYLNSNMHPDKVKPMQKLLMDFSRDVAVEAVNAELKEVEKELKRLESEQKKLEGDQSTYESDIRDCEVRIEERKKDLEDNAEDQEKKKQEIVEQQEAVNEVKEKMKKFK
ncbi:MAG: hypothetical protein JXR19_07055 [Bacteroidia bacterium]